MTNLGSIFKSRDFANKSPSSQSYGFSSGHVWMWELDCKESWAPKNWCVWTVVLEKTLESPLDCKEIHRVHSKRDQSWLFLGRNDAKAETPILWPPDAKSWLIGKDPDVGRDWGQEEKGTTEDEMAGWHHGLDGRECEWTPGVGDGQGGLACCDSWGRKAWDMTERLNWTELNYFTILYWFCHTLTWIHHGCTCVPHLETPSHIPPHTIPLGHPSIPALSILYHASNLDWRFISHDNIHASMPFSQIIPPSPSPRVQKTVLYICVSFSVSHKTSRKAVLRD